MVKNLILKQNSDLKFKFFTTSIYDIAAVSKTMSYSLSQLLKLEELNSKIKSFIRDFGSNYAILYTNSGLIISDEYTETMDAREFEEIISEKISDDLKFFQRLADEEVGIDGRLTYVEDKFEYVKKYEVQAKDKTELFYLGVSAPPNRLKEIKKELENFQPHLESTFQ